MQPHPPSEFAQELERATGKALAIRRVPLESLHLDPANARSHPQRNLDTIRGSLARFGQVEPLVVHKDTGRVIGGNGRLMAMKALGWTEVDVVEVDLSSIDSTALGLALNRSSDLAAWDERALAELLSTLRIEDALEGVGFDEREIDELLADADLDGGSLVEDPGAGEPPKTPITQLGDPRTARRWRQARDFPKPIRVGKSRRWRRRDIEAWIEGRGR